MYVCNSMKVSQDVWRTILTILLVVTFVLAATFTYFTQVGGSDIFLSATPDIFTSFRTDLIQARWLIYWILVIFVWQGLWIIYSLTLVCRVTTGFPSFVDPPLLTVPFLGYYILGLLFYIGFLLLLDRETFELAFVFILTATILFYVALLYVYRSLYRARFAIARQDRLYDDMFVRVLVQNGVSALVTYTLNATIQTMSVVIAYRSNPPLDPSYASTIALAIYAVIILALAVYDIVANDKYTRYTFSSYITNILLLSAILNNSGSARINSIITSTALGFDVSSLATKFSLVFVNSVKNPLFPPKEDISDEKSELDSRESRPIEND